MFLIPNDQTTRIDPKTEKGTAIDLELIHIFKQAQIKEVTIQ